MTAQEALKISLKANELSLHNIYIEITKLAKTNGSTVVILNGIMNKHTYEQLILDAYKISFTPKTAKDIRFGLPHELFKSSDYESGTFIISWC